MRQRGRKSAANLAIVPAVNGAGPQLEPPRYLNKAERSLFVELVSASGHFRVVDVPLLASLAQATLIARRSAHTGNLATWERAVRMQAMLSTRLRITPQARTDPKTVGRQHIRQGPAPWENWSNK
jgi:hypothetical protein